jgi:hypothetical protein
MARRWQRPQAGGGGSGTDGAAAGHPLGSGAGPLTRVFGIADEYLPPPVSTSNG